MSWEFRVGQKVACVDAADVSGLSHGEQYTIAAIIRADGVYHGRICSGDGLRLCEVRNPGLDHGAYHRNRFRPLVTDTQSWLREILEKPPENTRDLEHVGAGGLR